MRLSTIRERIGGYRARLVTPESDEVLRAAVALILHEPEGSSPEILFIERAEREGDPWSGQMALPGGRVDPGDRDLESTAARETREEVGVDLDVPVGRLDDFSGNRNPHLPPLIVSPWVYELGDRPELTVNHEVNSAVWIPVEWILHPESSVDYEIRRAAAERPGRERAGRAQKFPAIRYDRYTVWGLTYRILTNFFEVLGRDVR